MNVAQMWVVISVGIMVALIVLVVLCKRGGSIGTKQMSIYIPEAKKGNTPLGNSLQYLYDALPLIRQEYEAAYFTLAKNAGIQENALMSNEDVKFFIQMAGNFIYSGNGINSIKTILEQVLSAREWPCEKSAFEDYCGIIIRRISQTVTKYNNQNYDDYVTTSEGTLRQRTVNSVDVFKKLETLYRDYEDGNGREDGAVAKLILEILNHAIMLEQEGKK